MNKNRDNCKHCGRKIILYSNGEWKHEAGNQSYFYCGSRGHPGNSSLRAKPSNGTLLLEINSQIK